jgi:uncharacterized phage protein (TIGR02220 family)
MNGYIKLHRKILNWEWYEDSTVLRTFLHILLNANHREKEWRGITVQSGEMITSLNHLAKETGMTLQQTRTALKKLEATNEITRKTTNKYTTIKVLNWRLYQIEETENNKQTTRKATNEQQTNNKQITTNKNVKNLKNDKNVYKDIVDFLNEQAGTQYKHTSNKTKQLIQARRNEGFEMNDFKKVIQNKTKDWKNNEKMQRYLRPETLFGTKFESYLNENKSAATEIEWFKKYLKEKEND